MSRPLNIAGTRPRGNTQGWPTPAPFAAGVLQLFTVLLLAGCQDLRSTATREQDWPIARFSDDFNLEAPGEAWTFRTPGLWRVTSEGPRRFLQMAVPPVRPMMPGTRRPQEYGLYNKYQFRSFSMSCYVRIDRPAEVKGRDACFVFGRKDQTHLYYVHLSNYSDDLHNNIVCVEGQTRRWLLSNPGSRRPAITDTDWHRVDIVRDVDLGTIRVWVDLDPDKTDSPPLFEVVDRTYDWGIVGLGSFDDHASFSQFAIEGQARLPTVRPEPE